MDISGLFCTPSAVKGHLPAWDSDDSEEKILPSWMTGHLSELELARHHDNVYNGTFKLYADNIRLCHETHVRYVVTWMMYFEV